MEDTSLIKLNSILEQVKPLSDEQIDYLIRILEAELLERQLDNLVDKFAEDKPDLGEYMCGCGEFVEYADTKHDFFCSGGE